MRSSRTVYPLGNVATVVATLLGAFIVACTRDRQTAQVHEHQPAQRREVVDTATARAAMGVADSFLAQYLETTAKRSQGVVRYWSGDCALAEAGPSLLVGDYRVLSVGRRNDTLVVAAALTSVAEEVGSPRVANRFVVRPRIRTDTLHWRVVRDSSGKFVVCGFALEDVDLGGFGRSDNVDFERGSSFAGLRRQGDSLRRAVRRSPIR